MYIIMNTVVVFCESIIVEPMMMNIYNIYIYEHNIVCVYVYY